LHGFTGRLQRYHSTWEVETSQKVSRERQRKYRSGYTVEEMSVLLEDAHQHTAKGQELTLGRDHRRHERWTSGEDAALMADMAPPDHELALELGRTLLAVRTRRHVLKMRDANGKESE